MKKAISVLLVFVLLLTAIVFSDSSNKGDAQSITTTALTAKKPVILVAGVGGSKLFKDAWWGVDELWFDEDEALFSYSDNFLDPLAMSKTGTIVDSGVRTLRRSTGYTSSDIKNGLIDGIETYINMAFTDIFDGLIKELKNNGYVVGTNLFACPYDWRLDLNQSYQALDEVIELAKQKSGWDKVDIVAHSMGGLVTKRYLYESSANRSKVDKFITCGTPYLGSPNAAWALYVGDNFSALGGLLGVNPSKVRQLTANFPSSYQLLPSKRYYETIINASGGAQYTWDGIRYTSYFAENNYDMNRNGRLYDQYTYEEIGGAVYNWNGSSLYSRNAQYHDTINSVSLHNLGVKHYVIAGKSMPTLYVMRAKGGSSVSFEDFRFGDGDGTVPYGSGIDTGIAATAKYYVTNVEHGKFPSAAPVVATIKSILGTGSTYSLLKTSITAEITIDGSSIVEDDTDLSSSINGLLILCKSDELPVIHKKNNPKSRIGAGDDYEKIKDILEKGKEASDSDKEKLKDKTSKIIEKNIGEGAYIQQYGDMYVIYLPDKDDYTIKLKGSKKASIQIREFTNSSETILETMESIETENKSEEIVLEFNNNLKKLNKKK